MHETSIAMSLIDQANALVAQGTLPGRLVALNLRVGKFTAVMPDQLEFAFGIMTEGTALEGVRLNIEEVPVRARCRACDAEDEVEAACFLCASCGSPDVEIRSGREMILESVEVE